VVARARHLGALGQILSFEISRCQIAEGLRPKNDQIFLGDLQQLRTRRGPCTSAGQPLAADLTHQRFQMLVALLVVAVASLGKSFRNDEADRSKLSFPEARGRRVRRAPLVVKDAVPNAHELLELTSIQIARESD